MPVKIIGCYKEGRKRKKADGRAIIPTHPSHPPPGAPRLGSSVARLSTCRKLRGTIVAKILNQYQS